MDPWVEKQEKRSMKEAKRHFDMIQYIADAQNGIPTECPCGERMVPEVSPEPRYPGDRDWLPGVRYFTCAKYKASVFYHDGLHFRQPWVIGVEEEVEYLRHKVERMEEEIKNLRLELNKVLVSRGRKDKAPQT